MRRNTKGDVCSAEPWAEGESPLPRADMKNTWKFKVPAKEAGGI